MLHGQEKVAFGNAGYKDADKRAQERMDAGMWRRGRACAERWSLATTPLTR